MPKDYITLSPKHGVNPSITHCFWCGESMGVALLGKLKGDAKAPKDIVTDYEPCNKCKAMFDKGVHVIGVSTAPFENRMPPIQTLSDGTNLYPDGSYFVASEQYIRHLYEGNEESVNKILESKKLLMPSGIVQKIVQYNQQEDNNNENSESRISDSDTSESD